MLGTHSPLLSAGETRQKRSAGHRPTIRTAQGLAGGVPQAICRPLDQRWAVLKWLKVNARYRGEMHVVCGFPGHFYAREAGQPECKEDLTGWTS